jgi:DNA repair exonuclease SbcCD ATPase subunit
MRLVELELEDAFRFRHFRCEFHPGLTAIVGCNGSGKTTLTRAIRWTLFGDLGGYCRQADCVRQGAGPDGRACARLVVEHAGERAELWRSASRKSSSRRLVCGSRRLERDDDVSAFVESWVGLPAQAAADHVFVGQDEPLATFLRLTPARRAEYFHRLFRLDRVERVRQAVVRRLVAIDGGSAASGGEALRLHAAGLRVRLDAGRTRLASHPACDPDLLTSAREALQNARRRRDLGADSVRLTDMVNSLRDEALAYTDASCELSEQLRLARTDLAALDVDSAAVGLIAWRSIFKHADDLRRVEARLASLDGQDAGDVDPGEPPSWTDDDAAELGLLSAEVERLGDFLSTFSGGLVECPTCGTATATLSGEIERVRVRYPIAFDRRDELVSRRDAHQAAVVERDSYLRRRETRARDRAALDERLEDLRRLLPATPTRTEAELDSVVRQADGLRHEIIRLDTVCRAAERAVATSSASLAAAEERLDEVLLALVVTPHGGNVEDAAAVVDSLERLAAEQARLAGEVSSLEVALTSAETDLGRYDDADRRRSKLVDWRPDLEALRDEFHRDALPRRVALRYLNNLVGDTNGLLDELRVDFRIVAGDDLGFRARFPDGRDIPASCLSAGESACLAVAWHLAVNLAFASDVGLVCLDEPTAGLDGDRLGGLASALSNLRAASSGRGLQCVVVTHERSLLGAFDKVVDLSASPPDCKPRPEEDKP